MARSESAGKPISDIGKGSKAEGTGTRDGTERRRREAKSHLSQAREVEEEGDRHYAYSRKKERSGEQWMLI